MTQMQTDLETNSGVLDWANSCIISELLKAGQSDSRRALAEQESWTYQNIIIIKTVFSMPRKGISTSQALPQSF